jgi:hypothetical protein
VPFITAEQVQLHFIMSLLPFVFIWILAGPADRPAFSVAGVSSEGCRIRPASDAFFEKSFFEQKVGQYWENLRFVFVQNGEN